MTVDQRFPGRQDPQVVCPVGKGLVMLMELEIRAIGDVGELVDSQSRSRGKDRSVFVQEMLQILPLVPSINAELAKTITWTVIETWL